MSYGIRALLAISILVNCASLTAQIAPHDDEFRTSMIELERHYKNRDWPAALRVLDTQLAPTEGDQDTARRATVFYNKACVHAQANQKRQTIAAIRPR